MDDIKTILNILQQWQTLTGVLLGSFIGALMSLLGFYFGNKFEKARQRKEGRRRIEISVTRTVNDMHTVKISLLQFIKRTEKIVAEIDRVLADDTKYVLEETNLPPLNVFLDETLPDIITKSYYVHNKVLWSDAGVKSTNVSLVEMKQNFSALSRKNEFLVTIRARQREQKETYKANLQDFNNLISDTFITNNLDIGMKTLMQIKVYNSKMRGEHGWYMRWKYEGISLKYFRNKKAILNYNQESLCVDRIDTLIEPEVSEMINMVKEKTE